MADRFGYGSGSGQNVYKTGQYATGNSGTFDEIPLYHQDENAVTLFHNLVNGASSAVNAAKEYTQNYVSGVYQNGLIPALANAAKPVVEKADDFLLGKNSQVAEGLTDAVGALLDKTTFNDGLSNAAKSIAGINNYSGSAGTYSGYSSPGSASASSENPMQWYIDMVNQTTDKNNIWAAEQAQKQMDFQERMSNTQHQREVADLKAAGLNPALSAGASGGAGNLSGAMATPDTSNTRLLAELSLGSLQSLGNSAVAMASATNSKASNTFAGKLLNVASKYFIPAVARGAANALTRGIFG